MTRCQGGAKWGHVGQNAELRCFLFQVLILSIMLIAVHIVADDLVDQFGHGDLLVFGFLV